LDPLKSSCPSKAEVIEAEAVSICRGNAALRAQVEAKVKEAVQLERQIETLNEVTRGLSKGFLPQLFLKTYLCQSKKKRVEES
jgi:hypothetical protein